MPASKYELRNGTGTRFVFPEVSVDDVRNNVSGGSGGGGGSKTTTTRTLPGSTGFSCAPCPPCPPCNPSDCVSQLADCQAAGNELLGEYNELVEEYNQVVEDLEEACDQAPDGGSWGYNRNVYRISNSGSCSGYAHFQRETYNASLAKDITFLGNTVGYGYRIINNNTALALYRVYNVGTWSPNYRRVVPVRTDQLNADGSALCNAGMVGIVFAKVNPAKPSGYDSQQGGIAAGANGIGTYGVFARTLDTVDGTGAWYPDGPQGVSGSTLIGTITKASAEDLFDYASESSNPCDQKPPPFYNINYEAGTGGTISGISEQYIAPDGTGVTVQAIPNEGYTFTGWSDGSTIAQRQDFNPTSNGTLTANFVLTP
jgi:uncharacterized repeat protein (TIGR02543 family)